jgi:hypothetical protein
MALGPDTSAGVLGRNVWCGGRWAVTSDSIVLGRCRLGRNKWGKVGWATRTDSER